jgi:hypothetical protein
VFARPGHSFTNAKAEIMSIVKRHEEDTGYDFVDDSVESFSLSAVARTVTGVAAESGLGCFSADAALLRDLFNVADARPIPKGADAISPSKDLPGVALAIALRVRHELLK